MPNKTPEEVDAEDLSPAHASAARPSPLFPPPNFSSLLSSGDRRSSEHSVVSVSSATGSEAVMDTSLAIRCQRDVYVADVVFCSNLLFVCGCNLGRNTQPDEGATNSPEMVSGDSDHESQNKTESDDQDDELQRLQVLSMMCTKSLISISFNHN